MIRLNIEVNETEAGKQKGRGLNAPSSEAPLSACQQSTPSRAEWRALGETVDSEN